MASLFVRTYTFVDGATAYGSQVESEVSNIVTVLNNLNTAVTNWGQLSALHATSVPLAADCSGGSQDIADFKNNSVIKASISSSGVLTLVPTTNQIVLGTTRTITLSAVTPGTSSRIITFPDPGADCNVILSKGTPTMGAALAMGSNKITGLAAASATGDALRYDDVYTAALANIPMNSHKLTGLIAGSAAGESVRFEQIKYLQAVQATATSATTTTSTTFVNTALSCAITPSSASNRVKITITTTASGPGNDLICYTLANNTTNLVATTDGITESEVGVTTTAIPHSITYIDSPATTSATTYRLRVKSKAGGSVTDNPASLTAIMVCEEIV